MADKSSLVSFGQALLHREHSPLRDKIIALAAGTLTKPLQIDTVIGRYACVSNSVGLQSQKWLLFDFHRLFLYDDPALPDAAGIDSIVRFIIDDYPFKNFELLADYLNHHPFKFLYHLDTLDLLPRFWSSDRIGTLVVFDLVTAEIRVSKGHMHPQMQTTRPVAMRTVDRMATNSGQDGIRLAERLAGPGWRTDNPLRLEQFVSPDAGFIRGTRDLMSKASVPVAIARVAWKQGQREDFCGGISFRSAEASFVSHCEALERLHIVGPRVDEPLVHASYAELQDVAVDPALLFFAANGPERTRVEYHPNLPMYWTCAYNVLLDESRLVPAQEVWFNTQLLPGEHRCITPTTNACALGSCFEEAALFAMLEAIERDAHLITWYLRRACTKIDPVSVKFEPFQLLWARLEASFPNYHIYLFDVSVDIAVPTLAAIAVREYGTGPRSLYAVACRPLAERALFAVLKELAASLTTESEAHPRERYRKFLDEPELILMPEDHRALYSLDETFERLSFFGFDSTPQLSTDEINQRSPIKPQSSYNLREVLEDILRHLAEQGIQVLLKDLTFPMFANRLRCVKVIAPGLYPLWFGYNDARFAVTERLQRLKQRFTDRCLDDDSNFNLDVHPLS